MGQNIKVTQIVKIGSGGGGGMEALIPVLIVVAVAYAAMVVLSAVVAALAALLVWLVAVFGVALVVAIVLGIVFRKQIKATLFRPLVVHHGWGPAPEPVRAADPKQELHLHFHGDSEVDKAMLALRVASLHNESRMIGPGSDYDPVTGIRWDVLEGKVVR